ncbi:unnamed protein product [Orchesella dallaii]|uniref:Uncharacterized protein n=1 Tax=Orchesella dallaii TaxID=48710 RepID=A0ABP1RQ21_9HEXA
MACTKKAASMKSSYLSMKTIIDSKNQQKIAIKKPKVQEKRTYRHRPGTVSLQECERVPENETSERKGDLDYCPPVHVQDIGLKTMSTRMDFRVNFKTTKNVDALQPEYQQAGILPIQAVLQYKNRYCRQPSLQ